MTDTTSSATGDSAVLNARQAIFRSPGRRDGGAPATFSLAKGEVRVLAGDAKTTALEAIALAKSPSQGELFLFGTNVGKQRAADAPRLRRRIGMIFNDLRLIDDIDAWDNVALAVMAVGVAPRERASEIDEALAWVGLGRHAHLPAGGLSLEGRSRLAVARAMINSPELLIADEPHPATVGLLAALNRAGVALLLGASESDVVGRDDMEIIRLSAGGADAPSANASEHAA